MAPADNEISPRPVLIMAGGTGGHVFPALACAREFEAQGVPVHWLGTRHGLEARVVPQAGLPIYYLSVGGLRGKNAPTLVLAPFKLALALVQAVRVIYRLKPRAVLGFGGFVTGPGGVAAWLLRVPLFIHEQNAVPGFTNRVLARLARRLMQGFADTFPAPALTTGNPVRADIVALQHVEYTPHRPLRVLVTGGSLGALALNQVVPQALAQLHHLVEIRHQSGRGKLEALQQTYAEQNVQGELMEFIDDMAAAYAWADLVICRAGALTLGELALAGRPALLVPYPFAVDDHQTANGLFLVRAGAAILLPQVRGTHTPPDVPLLSAERLAAVLDEFSAAPERSTAMAAAARSLAKPDAARRVVEVCLGVPCS